MPEPVLRSVRVVRYAPGWGYSAAEWQRALDAVDWARAQPLKVVGRGSAQADTRVWRCGLAIGGRERDVVIKVELLGGVRRRVAAGLGWSRAMAQWRGAEMLERQLAGAGLVAGVGVARGVVLLRGPLRGPSRAPLSAGPGDVRGARAHHTEVLVMEAVPGRTVLEWAAAGDAAGERDGARRVARELGRAWAAMARSGVRLRDGKASNLIVREGDADKAATHATGASGRASRIVMVDTGGARAGAWSDATAARACAQVVIECIGCGVGPTRAMMMRAVRAFADAGSAGAPTPPREHARATVRRVWRSAAAAVRAHGDARPKDDPLGRN